MLPRDHHRACKTGRKNLHVSPFPDSHLDRNEPRLSFLGIHQKDSGSIFPRYKTSFGKDLGLLPATKLNFHLDKHPRFQFPSPIGHIDPYGGLSGRRVQERCYPIYHTGKLFPRQNLYPYGGFLTWTYSGKPLFGNVYNSHQGADIEDRTDRIVGTKERTRRSRTVPRSLEQALPIPR